MKVTFATKCWEKDWQHILNDRRLNQIIETNKYSFDERLLIVNNVSKETLKPLMKAVDHAISLGAFTDCYFVDDYCNEAIDAIGLRREDIGKGYIYSISEWVAIHLCKTKYLLCYCGDCISTTDHDWITPSLNLMEQDSNIKVSNPVWNYNHVISKIESVYETEDFYIGSGFSDQCFLIRRDDFHGDIYKEFHPDGEKYPVYGGDLFEKRVYCWMRNHQFLRATYKHSCYLHKNWN